MSQLNYIATANPSQSFITITQRFTEFLNLAENDFEYRRTITKLIKSDNKRLILSLDKIRQVLGEEFAQGLLDEPSLYFEALNKALKDVAKDLSSSNNLGVISDEDFYFVGLTGSFGDHHLTPRTLRAHYLGQLICLEGIVARCTVSRPKVARSVHYCEKTHLFLYKDYRDATNATSENPVTSFTYPTEDENGNPLVTEFGMSIYRDHQTITIQEMPEKAPPGQLPRSIDVLVDDDLVDLVKPGDRVRISGIYKSLGNRNVSQTSATFKTVVVGNYVRHIGTKSSTSSDVIPSTITLTPEDKKNINDICKKHKKDIVSLLSSSLMPSIYGHEQIKKAILLMLLGGVEKNLDNGTHIRGDINVLLVGDPSTAKSQVLRYVLNMANLAVATTGRGSSGVGLTAAVTTDPDSGERRLEAGAMVLADRGVVCIDEFDKMSDVDRVAIHEVMEQQTVTISKAGIHTSLNARCSVLAAANPVYGQYDETKDPHRNIALPDSLLSRFDLLFVVLDRIDESLDRSVANHVLKMHQYVPPGLNQGEVGRHEFNPLMALADLNINEEVDDTMPKPSEIYELNHIATNAGLPRGSRSNAKRDLLTSAFIKKYIYYAKSEIQPILTELAAEHVMNNYTELRNEKLPGDRRKTLPVTPRTLETIIRLATAHAKARLSTKVEIPDVDAAYELMRFALFKEATKKEKDQKKVKKKKAKIQNGSLSTHEVVEEEYDDDNDDDNDDDIEEDDYEEEEVEMEEASTLADGATQNSYIPGTELEPSRLIYLREVMLKLRENSGAEETSDLATLLNFINSGDQLPEPLFSKSEIEMGLKIMEDSGDIMYRDGTIFFV